MSNGNLVNCVACAEEIRADALLCRFCQTRQDDAEFSLGAKQVVGDLPESGESTSRSRKRSRLLSVGFAFVSLLIALATALVGIEGSRSSTAEEIEKAVAKQVAKLSVLELMGPLETVKCDPVGISIVFPETEYKCFASDDEGKGLIFKATMDWGTGIYQYGLDRG